MGDTAESNGDMIHRLQSSFGTSSSSLPKHQPATFNHLDIPQLNPSQFRPQNRQFSPNHAGIPPVSPYSQIPSHSRSLSQPSFFPLDSLPPLSPSPYRDHPVADVIEEPNSTSHSLLPPRTGENMPPRKAHRRSNSDIPFGFNPNPNPNPKPIQLVKRETSASNGNVEGEVVDDLFSAYMNLDNLETLNSSENRDDLDSRVSGTKTYDSSDNEATSSVNESGNKRRAGGDIGPATRHYRSVSMDSFMERMNFGDESPKVEVSPGGQVSQLSPSNSVDSHSNTFSLEFGNGEFTGAELKKIMANEKLAEIALADPKRAKRILANRQSAARSKERKMRYITELEHKVQTLQTEATTLSAQLTLLQRDSAGLTSQNNELKFRLQAMEQQAQLQDSLSEALTAEVQRLKITTAEINGDAAKFSQLSISPQMFQLHQRQQSQQQNSNSNQ